jgi:hypothetical protein
MSAVLPPIVAGFSPILEVPSPFGIGSLYKCVCLSESTKGIPLLPVVSDWAVPGRHLGTCYRDAASGLVSGKQKGGGHDSIICFAP